MMLCLLIFIGINRSEKDDVGGYIENKYKNTLTVL